MEAGAICPDRADSRTCRQLHQAATEMTHQPAAAAMKAASAYRSTSSEKISAKPSMPMLPSDAPAASRAAACWPRRSPSTPASRLRRCSCFSISVALAQKTAGSARNRPPTDAPNRLLITPVATVAIPPSTKRMRYSYQRPSLRGEDETLTITSTLRREDADRARRTARQQVRQWSREARSNADASGAGRPGCCR